MDHRLATATATVLVDESARRESGETEHDDPGCRADVLPVVCFAVEARYAGHGEASFSVPLAEGVVRTIYITLT